MTLLETVVSAVEEWPAAAPRQVEVAVPTHCLYPSNAIVRAYVTGGSDAYRVTDGAGALDEFFGGDITHGDLAVMRSIARAHGLNTSDSGIIFSGLVDRSQLVGTIVLVANASKEAAHALESRAKPVRRKNFRELLAALIDAERVKGSFVSVSMQRQIVGASTKLHKFDFDISLVGERRLLLDAVVPEPSSVNAVLVANLDVKAAKIGGTVQRIVYDDEDDWRSADLALLNLGATVVSISKLRPVLTKLAA